MIEYLVKFRVPIMLYCLYFTYVFLLLFIEHICQTENISFVSIFYIPYMLLISCFQGSWLRLVVLLLRMQSCFLDVSGHLPLLSGMAMLNASCCNTFLILSALPSCRLLLSLSRTMHHSLLTHISSMKY